jgi:SET domain-containing protein
MKNILSLEKIYVKISNIKGAGQGVFARKIIKKNEIIENCPFIELSESDPANLLGSKLVTYFFYFGKNKERIAIALGFGSFYNHSNEPNAKFEINEKEKIIVFTAIENIKEKEEITFNYRGCERTPNKRPLWFE